MLKFKIASDDDAKKAYAEWWLALEDFDTEHLQCLWEHLLNVFNVVNLDSEIETLKIPGRMINKLYKLRGYNRYPEDSSVLAINTSQMKLQASRDRKTILKMKDVGFRWYTDIIDNKVSKQNKILKDFLDV